MSKEGVCYAWTKKLWRSCLNTELLGQNRKSKDPPANAEGSIYEWDEKALTLTPAIVSLTECDDL